MSKLMGKRQDLAKKEHPSDSEVAPKEGGKMALVEVERVK